MKKRFFLVVTFIIIATMVMGCSSGISDASATVEEPSGAVDEQTADLAGTQLVVMSSQNWVNDTDYALAEKFEEETGIAVDIQAVPDDQYSSVVLSKLASGEGPDIYYATTGAAMTNYMPEKMLDLTGEAWLADCKDWAINSVTYNDKIVGLNRWSLNGWLIMYNKAIFENYGLAEPANFDEFEALCQTLLDNGIQPIFENSADSWHDSCWFNQLTPNLIAEDPDAISKLNNFEAKLADYKSLEEGLAKIEELYSLGYCGDTYLSDIWSAGYDAMGTGSAAMILTYTAYEFEVEAMYPDKTADSWGCFLAPVCNENMLATSAGGEFSAINVDSKNIEAAKVYFSWLAEQANLQEYYDGHPEQNMTAFNTVEVAKKSPLLTEIENDGVEYVTELGSAITYFDGVKLATYMQEMHLGNMTPHDVLVAMDEYRQQMKDMEG